ncbi:hypothetical protein BVY04_02785 [bacterium M21]|nr:hypothetical protein BVY04_02785 [bacterium M21]
MGKIPRIPRNQEQMEAHVQKFFGTALMALVPLIIISAIIIVPIFIWFGCRIEVGPGEFKPLLKKTGKDLDNGMVLAPSLDFKGPQFEILKEGRHFRNPFTWSWPIEAFRATVIEDGKVGILIRRHGKPLPEGRVIALADDEKGILREPIMAGRHYINRWAYSVEVVDMVKVEPGHMGVVTLQVGNDPEDRFAFTVNEDERGVQPALLQPGTHPLHSNKYVYRVDTLDVRSHKLEMSDRNSIKFPSKFGFDIRVEGTIEWAPRLEKLPELFVKFVDEADLERSGGIENIQQKIILPFARSFFRTVGGSYRAVDYITGSTRVVVQNEVGKRLREACAKEGILIKSVVIKATKPPEKISQQYERREIARRMKDRYEKEIEMEVGNVVMVGQTPMIGTDGEPMKDDNGKPVMIGGKIKTGPDGKPISVGGRLKREIHRRKKDREQRLGTVREEIAKEIRDAEQYKAVKETQARRELEVAKIKLEAAKDRAAATLAQGQAEAEVTVMSHKAEAEGVKAKVAAFGQGNKYAEYTLVRKLAPGINEILSNTDGLFAQLFERFITVDENKTEEK